MLLGNTVVIILELPVDTNQIDQSMQTVDSQEAQYKAVFQAE